ncbi:uncharacterized protein LOC134746774 [Cydia strobilella]|uniref:uncharacterized protein LOC134746774 n=1 Tax=Cydia strobilella TaxID=1100964 RepID=UPI0030050FAB
MGKRKYNTESEEAPKKIKTSEDVPEAKNEKETDEQPQKVAEHKKAGNKQHGFDVKHFRKELASKTGQTMALTQFLQVCLNPDSEVDYMAEYLNAGGNSHEILRQINQDSKMNLTLATPAFHLFHLIIMKVQSSHPQMFAITEEASRYFLNTFMPTVEIMISENSGPRHRKIVLKLLTSIVTLNSDLGVEVINQAPLTPKHLQYILEKPNYKEKDNVRTSFVHFMTSFLVDGHLPLIKALLEKQGLLPLVIPGLIHDEPDSVLMFLNILKKNVIENSFISKSLKLKTFSHQVLFNIFKLYSWKGPPELSQEARNRLRPDIMALLSEIVLTLFTSHKLGLYFTDNTLGMVDANKNQNLYKALLTLKRPWETEEACEVILKIVYKCPDLHRAIINIVEQSFEPQHSPIWEKTLQFAIKLLDVLKPEDMVPRMGNLSSIQVINFARYVTLPIPLLKFMQTHLGKDRTISLYCVKILVKMLESLRRYIRILEMEDSHVDISDLRSKMEYFFPKHMPVPTIIATLIQDVISGKEVTDTTQDYRLTKISETDSLIYLMDLLLLYNDIHPTFFEMLEGSLDMRKILDFSMTLTVGRVSLLKFKVVSLWLTLDSSAISLSNPMFKDLFNIMLEVYTNTDDNTWIEAKDTICKFFKNTGIFEGDEDEIHLMLYTLRNSRATPTILIGDLVQYVLENSKDLTENIRNQIVNFEISDQTSEANLDKLFNDLMKNKNTENTSFLENKVPSPFIVGCMQYIQGNKEARKSLKQFLSIYVANLLHANYAPELTEIVIGDSKVDARSYVASWTSEPEALSDNLSGRDDTIKNISASIIGNSEILLKDIFQCLEEVSSEECDIIIEDVPYKVNTAQIVDGSELLIWAKYLIFCTVRLTNMNSLTEYQQKKINLYFDCLILIGKKCHMRDVCRTIVLSLFKNPHYLNIYTPLDLSKNPCNTLATKFLLEVMTRHADIMTSLNKTQKVLKPYQQKNRNEIVKAFIKINKRKNVNSDHTIKVLEIIGLSEADDVTVLQHIFTADPSACVKDDKEPSLMLEVLRVLVSKYSKTVTIELPKDVFKGIVKVYTNLLTNKEMIPNLTNIENSLIEHFENKPHQVKHVSEEQFKNFFQANSIRKTTSLLAATLLKLSQKFCKIFKVEIDKPEILSQRELTLPLGNAIIHHETFLVANKDFLPKVYEEYKSNILKVLEKPHKAGQVYISSWKFIRKLILECMSQEECEKIFNKIHKFETAEISHIHLFQACFLKMSLSEKGHKKDYLINYLSSSLNLITIALQGSNTEVLKDLAQNIHNVIRLAGSLKGFDVDNKESLVKITESSIWQNFCKAVLKNCLKVRSGDQENASGPLLLETITNLVKLFYPNDHSDLETLFDMVTSHSEFLNVMLSYHSLEIKSRLIELLYVLLSRKQSVMKTQQIPVFLSAYHATRSPCDRLILKILNFYETHRLPVNEYKPYLWGDSAANFYAVRKNRSASLWSHPTPNQVMNLLDKEIIDRTVRNFPVTEKLSYDYELPSSNSCKGIKEAVRFMSEEFKILKDYEGDVARMTLKLKYDAIISELKDVDIVNASHVEPDEGIYDPAFVFPLLSHLLAPGSMASCFKMLRSGLLSLPVVALSSHCPDMRAAAYHVLHRFHMLLETETRHKNDKLLLTDFIETLRHSLSTAINSQPESGLKNPRLPSLDALYLAKSLMVCTAPFDPLYKPVNNFLIAKQFVDLTVVPDFLSLFHDCDVESSDRRLWILDIIKHGTKTMTDISVIFKTMCLKMIMDFYSSVLSDRRTKEKILGAIGAVVAIPRALQILVEGYGLVSWLHFVVRQLRKEDKTLIKGVLNIIKNILHSMYVNSLSRHISAPKSDAEGKPLDKIVEIRVNREIEGEILVLLYDLLYITADLETEDLISYVKTYSLLSKNSIKLLTKEKVLGLVEECCSSVKDSEKVILLRKSAIRNNTDMLKSKNLNVASVGYNAESNELLLIELTSLVQNYISVV